MHLEIPNIKGFIKTSFLDWRGKISSVIFLGGCNFRCPYCHNLDLIFHQDELPTIPFTEIQEYLSLYDDWLDGVVISGGEPCLNENILNLCNKLKQIGQKIKLDTNGSRPQILSDLLHERLIDYVAMDFKAPLNEMSYQRCTGTWNDIESIEQSLDLILENAEYSAIDYEFRVTLCSSFLGLDDLKSMISRIKGAKRFVLQNFIPRNTLDPSLKNVQPYSKKTLEEIKKTIAPSVQEVLIIDS